MGIVDGVMNILPEKYRRDLTVGAVAISVAWVAFGYNGRLDAAEAKAESAAAVQQQVQQIKADQAVMRQKVDDTDQNVQRLVSALLGQAAVVHHPDPPKK